MNHTLEGWRETYRAAQSQEMESCGYLGCKHPRSPYLSQWYYHLRKYHQLGDDDALDTIRPLLVAIVDLAAEPAGVGASVYDEERQGVPTVPAPGHLRSVT